MASIRDWFARTFGAPPHEPQPTDPVELRPWMNQVEAGAVLARLRHHGIDAWWPTGDAAVAQRYGTGAVRGPVLVRVADLDRANAVLDDVIELDAHEG